MVSLPPIDNVSSALGLRTPEGIDYAFNAYRDARGEVQRLADRVHDLELGMCTIYLHQRIGTNPKRDTLGVIEQVMSAERRGEILAAIGD